MMLRLNSVVVRVRACQRGLIHRGRFHSGIFNSARGFVNVAKDEEEQVGVDDPRVKILEASLHHVNRRGWSEDALAAGAVEAGYPPVTHGLFKRGAAELAEYWMEVGNERLESFLEEQYQQGVCGDDLVVSALCFRLEHTIPYLRSWPQAMALGLYPENVPNTLVKLHAIPELICKYANASEDSNAWEERKAAIGGIYAAAELYMLTDYSEGYKDTRSFVAARLRDSLMLQDKAGPTADTLSAIMTGVSSLVTATASMVSPLVPRPPGPPPNPQEFVSKFAQTFSKFPDAARTGMSDTTSQRNQAPSPSHGFRQDVSEFEESSVVTSDVIAPIVMPKGMSTFGLKHMSSKEATDIIKANNPGFIVEVTRFDDNSTNKQQHGNNFVRLIVDENNIVLDIERK